MKFEYLQIRGSFRVSKIMLLYPLLNFRCFNSVVKCAAIISFHIIIIIANCFSSTSSTCSGLQVHVGINRMCSNSTRKRIKALSDISVIMGNRRDKYGANNRQRWMQFNLLLAYTPTWTSYREFQIIWSRDRKCSLPISLLVLYTPSN